MSQKPYNGEKNGLNLKLKLKSPFYPGDLVTCTGEPEISTTSLRLPDNPGELA